MFKKLALSPTGLIFVAAGFTIMFAGNLIGRRGLVMSLAGGLIGFLGFAAVWCLIVGLILTLFSSTEVNSIFFHGGFAKTSEGTPPSSYSLDDEDDLTAEDLYSPQHVSDLPPLDDSLDTPSAPSVPSLESLLSGGKNVRGGPHLEAGGRFNLQSGEKVLRTNVKEAALAARKVLMNDKL